MRIEGLALGSRFLIWGKGGGGMDSGQGVGLRWSDHPLGGTVCRGHVKYPSFASDTLLLLPAPQVGSQKLDFPSFCVLFINCQESLCMQLFLVLVTSYFVV